MRPPRVLIVAGSDSGGGAGIQADIKTVTMLGGHPMTAIAALTAQNTLGVTGVFPVPAEFVLAQIDAVAEDIGVDAVKIGMIGSPETAVAVAERLGRMGRIPIVFDPVMVASSGSVLADEATIAAFERLMEVATLVTPNLPELAVLTGREIDYEQELEEAALALADRVQISVLAKGGHLPSEQLADFLAADGKVHRWKGERIDTRSTHGTGCTLSSAIACELGRGASLKDAVTRGRDYTRAAIEAAPGFGQGQGPMGHALGRVPYDDIHRKS